MEVNLIHKRYQSISPEYKLKLHTIRESEAFAIQYSFNITTTAS